MTDLVLNAKAAPTVGVGEVGTEGLVYVDTTAVAPSPSRDYYRLHVSHQFVRVTRWQISHRSSPMIPTETKVPLDKYHSDNRLTSEVGRIFGKPMARYVAGLSQGHFDTIIRLPLKPLALIMEYVGIKSMDQLAPVCKRFSEVAAGNTLWKEFYKTYTAKGIILKDAHEQAKHYGWRTVFLIHRLHEKVFPGKVMRFGLSHPEEKIGDAEEKPVSKLFQRLLQQEQNKLASCLHPPKPLRPTKSLDDYLREGEAEAEAAAKAAAAEELEAAAEAEKAKPRRPARSFPTPGTYFPKSRSLMELPPKLMAEKGRKKK